MRVRTNEVVWQELDDGIVVLNLTTSRYLRINASASVLWRRLEHGANFDELVAALLESFEIDETTARRDVETFVTAAKELELIVGE